MKKTVMVTGASGYIGRHVVSSLLAKGVEVYAVDLLNRGVPEGATFYAGNILDDAAFVGALPVPSAILHLAWQDGFQHNAKSHLDNLSKHLEFLKTVVEKGTLQVAVMGTMHEVGYWHGAIDENTPCNPLSMYGIAKNALRQALIVALKNKPVTMQWLRAYYIYGDDHFNHSIFTKLLQAAEAGHATFPFTSGKNQYDFLQIDELANRIAAVVTQTKVDGIINCCSGKPVSLADAVEKFIKIHDLRIKLEYGAFPDRPYDSPAVWGDATKINAIMEM